MSIRSLPQSPLQVKVRDVVLEKFANKDRYDANPKKIEKWLRKNQTDKLAEKELRVLFGETVYVDGPDADEIMDDVFGIGVVRNNSYSKPFAFYVDSESEVQLFNFENLETFQPLMEPIYNDQLDADLQVGKFGFEETKGSFQIRYGAKFYYLTESTDTTQTFLPKHYEVQALIGKDIQANVEETEYDLIVKENPIITY